MRGTSLWLFCKSGGPNLIKIEHLYGRCHDLLDSVYIVLKATFELRIDRLLQLDYLFCYTIIFVCSVCFVIVDKECFQYPNLNSYVAMWRKTGA